MTADMNINAIKTTRISFKCPKNQSSFKKVFTVIFHTNQTEAEPQKSPDSPSEQKLLSWLSRKKRLCYGNAVICLSQQSDPTASVSLWRRGASDAGKWKKLRYFSVILFRLFGVKLDQGLLLLSFRDTMRLTDWLWMNLLKRSKKFPIKACFMSFINIYKCV